MLVLVYLIMAVAFFFHPWIAASTCCAGFSAFSFESFLFLPLARTMSRSGPAGVRPVYARLGFENNLTLTARVASLLNQRHGTSPWPISQSSRRGGIT